jgi:hypothetical protein
MLVAAMGEVGCRNGNDRNERKRTEGMENFMDRNEAVEIKCECGNVAVHAVAFRTAPRVLCRRCYEAKSIRWSCSEEFLIDALEVIEREQSLKHSTLARLRRFVEAHWRDEAPLGK